MSKVIKQIRKQFAPRTGPEQLGNLQVLTSFLIFLLTGLIFTQGINAQDTNSIELPATTIRSVDPNIETIIKPGSMKLAPKNIQKLNTTVDLPYVLNQTPAVVVSSDAGTGTGYTGLRIRGSDISRINVNLNGIPVNDAEGQGAFFVDFPDILSSATELTIERGIGHSRNGYGNFGGAISINNLDIQNEGPGFSFMTDYASYKTLKTFLKASTGFIENKWNTTIRLSKLQSDGYIERSAARLNAAQITSQYRWRNTRITFHYLSGKERTGQAWNGVAENFLDSNRRLNELGLMSNGSYYDNQTDNYGQQYYQLFFDQTLNPFWKTGGALFYTRGSGYYEEYKISEPYSDYGLNSFTLGPDTIQTSDLIRQLWLDNHFYGGRAYLNYFGEKMQTGIYFNYSQYIGRHYGEIIWAQQGIDKNYRWYDLGAFKNDYNLYAMFKYRLTKNWNILMDAQWRNVYYQIDGFRKNPELRHRLNYLFFNPKIQVEYVSGRHFLHLFLARSSKEPNRDDFEQNITNHFPKPERLTDIELNYQWKFNQNASLHSTLYYMHYTDQLVLNGKINDVGGYTRVNIPKSYRCGLEIVLQWRVHQLLRAQANISLSRNKILHYTEYLDDYDQYIQVEKNYDHTDIAFSPSWIAGAQFSVTPFVKRTRFFLKDLSIDLLPKYVSRQYLDNTETISKSIHPYSVTDILLQLPVPVSKRGKLILRGGIYNLFNTMYESNGYTFSYIYNQILETYNYYYPQSPRRYSIGIGWIVE